MAESTLWWLAAGALIAVELVTGTFYMLMISVGLVAAALGAHAGVAVTWQWVIAALVGGGSIVVWRRIKGSQPPVAPARANRDVNMDIGEVVHVDAFNDDGTCSVHYRGARWDAVLAPEESAESGSYTIVEVVGSRLILKKTLGL
ncbi:NfeD family protein [Rhodoferax sp.]|uniref:NfeD family protein n=1 Tax=Rhodoferax sp. TaxID=50421 RepID=UPI002851ADFF|nr:NfeD family protein [Rhodoferax sp.]MDR3371738.1 NfeD family protein [Rhodoferax sp.]